MLAKRRWLLRAAGARRLMSSAYRYARAGWWFSLPALLLIAVFFLLPVVAALLLSFTDFDLYALADPANLRYYRPAKLPHAAGDADVLEGARQYGAVRGAGRAAVAAGFARRGAADRFAAGALPGLFRTAFFAPVVTTLVAVALIWRYLLHTRYGLLNYLLTHLGLPAIDWLGDPHWSMPAIVLLAVWKNFGYNMIILIAALQAIPEELYDAARLEGAGAWARLRHITLPLLAPDARAGGDPDRQRLFPAVRRAVRDDPGRPAAEHGQRALFHVRAGLHVVEARLRLGGGVRAVRADPAC